MDTLNISALPSQSEPVLTTNGQLLPQTDSTISFGDAYAETAAVVNINTEETNSVTMPRAENLAQAKALIGPPAVLVEAIIAAISTALYITATKKTTEEITRSTAETASTGQKHEDGQKVFMNVAQGVADDPDASPNAEKEPQVTFGTITKPIIPVHESELNQITQTDNDIPETSGETDIERPTVSLRLTDDSLQDIVQSASLITKEIAKQQDTTVKTAPVHTFTPEDPKTAERHLYDVQHENVLISKTEIETFPSSPLPFNSLSSPDEDVVIAPNTARETEFTKIQNSDEAEPILFIQVSSTDANESGEKEVEILNVANNGIRPSAIDISSISNASMLNNVEHNSSDNISQELVNIESLSDNLTPNSAPIMYWVTQYPTRDKSASSAKNLITPMTDQRDASPVPTNPGNKDIRLKEHEAVSINMPQIRDNPASSLLTGTPETDRNDYPTLNKTKSINLNAQEQSSDGGFNQSKVNAKKTAEMERQQSKLVQIQKQADLALNIEPVSVARIAIAMTQELRSNMNVAFTHKNNSVEEAISSTKATDELIGPNLELADDVKEVIDRRKTSSMKSSLAPDGSIEPNAQERTQPKTPVLRSTPQNIAPEGARDSKSAEISENLRFRALERQVIAAARDGANQIRMQLYPPGIGQILIRLALDGSKLRLQIKTSSIEATNSLNEMKDALRSALSDSGFTITSLDVTDGNNDQNEDRKRERNPSTSQEVQNDHPEFSLELQA